MRSSAWQVLHPNLTITRRNSSGVKFNARFRCKIYRTSAAV